MGNWIRQLSASCSIHTEHVSIGWPLAHLQMYKFLNGTVQSASATWINMARHFMGRESFDENLCSIYHKKECKNQHQQQQKHPSKKQTSTHTHTWHTHTHTHRGTHALYYDQYHVFDDPPCKSTSCQWLQRPSKTMIQKTYRQRSVITSLQQQQKGIPSPTRHFWLVSCFLISFMLHVTACNTIVPSRESQIAAHVRLKLTIASAARCSVVDWHSCQGRGTGED